MKKSFCAIAIVFLIFGQNCNCVFTPEAVDDYLTGVGKLEVEGINECYGITCPEKGIFACSKLSKTTKDADYIDVVIKCEDENGNGIRVKSSREANPFPGTQFSSFSFRGNYGIKLRPTVNENNNQNFAPTYNVDPNPKPKYNFGVNSKDNEVELIDQTPRKHYY